MASSKSSLLIVGLPGASWRGIRGTVGAFVEPRVPQDAPKRAQRQRKGSPKRAQRGPRRQKRAKIDAQEVNTLTQGTLHFLFF